MTTIDHIILKVNDLARSLEFYEDVLGFRNEGRQGPFTVLRVSPTFQIQLAPYGTQGMEHYAFAMTKTMFNATLSRLRARGIPFGPRFDSVGKEEGIGQESGALGMAPTVYFNDPDKHLLEVRTYEG